MGFETPTLLSTDKSQDDNKVGCRFRSNYQLNLTQWDIGFCCYSILLGSIC